MTLDALRATKGLEVVVLKLIDDWAVVTYPDPAPSDAVAIAYAHTKKAALDVCRDMGWKIARMPERRQM